MLSSYTPLEAAIIKTLAYFQALNASALSLIELRRYYVGEDRPSLHALSVALSALFALGVVRSKNGFWALFAQKNLLQERPLGTKEAALKWKRTSRITRFLPLVPYVRGISITGSVALNNAQEKSDIDVLLLCADGRVWITRFLVTVISFLLRRRRYGTHISNRLCFNHYTTTTAPALGPASVDAVVQRVAVPLWRFNGTVGASRFTLSPNPVLLFLKYMTEKALNITRIGDGIEYALGNAQIKKIASNEVPYPTELPQPSLASSNLIFYYPRVKETERAYQQLLALYS